MTGVSRPSREGGSGRAYRWIGSRSGKVTHFLCVLPAGTSLCNTRTKYFGRFNKCSDNVVVAEGAIDRDYMASYCIDPLTAKEEPRAAEESSNALRKPSAIESAGGRAAKSSQALEPTPRQEVDGLLRLFIKLAWRR